MRRFEGYMRGINLGGWLSQCDETTKKHFDTFITGEDIACIAKMGFDHVRLPIDYMYLEDEEGAPLESGYRYVDSCIAWAKEAGLHVLLDLHKTFGYSFDPLDKEMDREIFFHDRKLQERFFRLWERIASRYASEARDGAAAFELLNEIVSPAVADAWNKVADEAIRRIRTAAPEAYVVVGGVRYNNVTSVPLLNPPLDDHVVYNFHCYEPIVFTHQKAYWVENMSPSRTVHYPDSLETYRQMAQGLAPELVRGIETEGTETLTEAGPELFEMLFKPAIGAAEKYNVPLYCGEYGVIDQAPVEDALRWYADISAAFEKYGIGRAMWTYRRKDFGLADPHYDAVRDKLVRCLLPFTAGQAANGNRCLTGGR